MLEYYINDAFFNLKFNNVKNNKNRYHDKLIEIPLTQICKNIKKYIFFLKNNISNKNYNILISNDNIFYTGILIIFLGIIIEIISKILKLFYIF